jgi:predicted membrane-bound spermidine synthase
MSRPRSSSAARADAPSVPAPRLAAEAPARGRAALFALFSISGFAGLIYESIWTHYLKLFLGHAAYAQALVLAIFMGGMAVGSWLASRYVGRWRNLLVAYALVEAVIGILALVFHEAFVATTGLAYDRVIPMLAGSPAAVSAFKWCLAALLIAVQSVLLGMTFPLMTAGVLRAFPDRPGRSLAMLYFTNSIGAVAGVLVSGFVLVRYAGLPGTVRIAGLLNLLVAAEVWRRFGARRAEAVGPAPTPGRPADRSFALFLAVSLVTGASSFIYEVAWIRMLSLVLGASTHAFEVMLSAFILGLALGGLWIQRRIDGLAHPVRYLAIVQVAMGMLALATLPAYGSTFEAMRWLVVTLPKTSQGYALFNLASNGIALAVMLPATFCAGMTLPLITHWLMHGGYGERAIGAVYASNTLGAILAVFFATHVGMPLLGLKGLLTLGAALDLTLGLALAWMAGSALRVQARVALSVGCVAAIALTLGLVHLDPYRMASGVYRSGQLLSLEAEQILFHRDGKTATVSVVANGSLGQVRISTNGKIDAAVTMVPTYPVQLDESTMILLGMVPMSLKPDARTAAAIGFGAGISTDTLLANPRLESVDTIEIEPEMVRGAERFRPRNERAYTDARSHVHFDDAKTFFSSYGKRYDLLISEPSNPWVSGVAGLFSDEFYRHARRHLNQGGLFVQWIQLYEIEPELVMSVLKAIERNFSDYVVYAANDLDAIIVARDGGALGEPDPAFIADPAFAGILQRAAIMGPQDLALRRIGDRRSWAGLTDSFAIPANSDFDPVLDQKAARARFVGNDAGALLAFGQQPLPAVEMLAGKPADRTWTAVMNAPFFDGSRRAIEATLLRDLLLRPDRSDVERRLPKPMYESASPFVAWVRDCATTASRRQFPLPSFLAMAQATMADLSPAELRSMWQPVVSGSCAAQLAPVDRAWVQFVAAVSGRDAVTMATTARALLGTSKHLSDKTVRYLVAAGMLGSIARGDAQEAAQLWATYAGSLDIEQDLLLRMLVARAHGS